MEGCQQHNLYMGKQPALVINQKMADAACTGLPSHQSSTTGTLRG